MKHLSAVAPLFLLCLLSACGGGTNSEEMPGAYSRDEVNYILSHREVRGQLLEPSSGIFSGVGMVMKVSDHPEEKNKFSIGFCTGFLAEDNHTLITNAHCVPEKVRKGLVHCGDRVYFANSHTSANYACRKVLFASSAYKNGDFRSATSLNSMQPDVVILEIDPVMGVLPLELSKKVITNKETMEFQSLDPINGNHLIMKYHTPTKKCKVQDKAKDGYPYRVTKGCDTRHGNSGSPVLDENNKVSGILAVMITENRDAISSKESGIIDLSCLVNSLGTWSWKSSCPKVAPFKKLKN